MKRFVKGLLLAVGVLVGSSAWAQAICPPGTALIAILPDGQPSCAPQAGGGGDSGGNGGYVPPEVIHLPTSYGAVAWDVKAGVYGYSSKQTSERASEQAALADCGTKNCKITSTYSNSCTAMAHGQKASGGGFSATSGDVDYKVAEQKVLSICNASANNCQIIMSECSLPGQIEGR